MTKQWFDCVKEPSEIGKKVLCQHKGNFYVAVRIERLYISIPFSHHYFWLPLCYPETWSEIDFPEPYTGYYTVCPDGNPNNMIKLSEARESHPEVYWQFAQPFIDSIEKLKNPIEDEEK